MAQPASIQNTRSQSMDTIYAADGTPLIKLAIGIKSVGLTPDAGWQGVASHADGDTFNTADGALVVAGVESGGGTVVKLLADALGKLLLGQLADDSALAGGDYAFPMGGRADESSTDSVDEGDIGIPRITLDRKQIITPYAHPAGGATPYHRVSTANTNDTNIKASPGKVYSLIGLNKNASVRYLKVYDTAATPVVGTDVPVLVVPLPQNVTVVMPFGDIGLDFAAGIGIGLTTGITDADTGAVAADDIVVSLAYA